MLVLPGFHAREVEILIILLLIQRPDSAPMNISDGGPGVFHMGDPDGMLDSWLWPRSDLPIMFMVEVNQHLEDCFCLFYLSLSVTASQKISKIFF